MEVLLRGQLGGLVREGVARRLPVSEKVKSWRDILPLFITVTMETMYPLVVINLGVDVMLISSLTVNVA